MTNEELLSKVAEMINESNREVVEEKKGLDFFEGQIKLNETISSILKESTNEKLNAFCRDYANQIANGVKESRLYESFISGVSQWNWLNAVDTHLSAIADRVNKYKQEIDFSKILNVMKETDSYYIVPLIEEVVIDYMNNKSGANRATLKDRLMCFHHDPFVNEMLNILYYDKSINESLNLENLENQVRSKVTIEKIFSPIQVIKENECVFNVKGTYYNRKGNNITRFNKNDIASLNENFVNLCNLINSDFVKVEENCITVYDDTKIAYITESNITINGKVMTIEQINEAKNVAFFSRDNANFYDVVLKLNESFNDIACVDFAKRVSLNGKEKRSVDIFKIKENLSVTTHDELGRHTFYRNSNPIQTSNIINEHMNLNVSNLFEELQSNSEQVREEILSTRKSYENCIAELKERLTQLEGCAESCTDDKDVAELNQLKEEVEDELARVENDYKEYQKTSDEFLNGNGDVDSEDPALVNGVEGEYKEDLFTDEEPQETPNEIPDDDIDTSDLEQPIQSEPTEYDGLFDETPYYDNNSQTNSDPYEPSIVSISYAENIKTGTITNRGEVNVLIPSVDANGDVKNELQRITFTLDADRNPIINNEYMPVALYNKIKDAILAHEQTQSVDVNGTASFDEPVDEPITTDVTPEVDNNVDLFTDDDTMEEPIAKPSNPIDAAYGVEDNGDIITTNDDLFGDEEATIDNIEPAATDAPEPEDLEAAGDGAAVKLWISEQELVENGIKDNHFKAYLKMNNIPGLMGMRGEIKVVIRDFEAYNKFREFFLDNGWTRAEFRNFFPELSKFESVGESKVVVAYSNNLETILESNSLPHKISKKGDKIMILNAVCEGVVITVKDDKTGKTVTINTDELNDTDSEAAEHEENTQNDVTFGDDNAQTDNTEENGEGEEEATEETSEETPNESNEGGTEVEKEDKKPSKKFRIKKKKTDESLGITEYDTHINENDSVQVTDEVKYKNKNGNVVSKLSNGDIIVEFGAETNILKPNAIKVITDDSIPKCVSEPTTKSDAVPTNESYCGIFFNGMRISPANCKTNLEKYNEAKNNDMIEVVVEGVKSAIEKQYVKLLS